MSEVASKEGKRDARPLRVLGILLATSGLAGACAADDGAGGGTTAQPTTEGSAVATQVDSTGPAPDSTGSVPSSTGVGSGSTGPSTTSMGIECPDEVAFEDIQSIFEANCVAYCHSKAGVSPQLDLSDPAYDRIVDVAGGEQIPLSGNAALRLIAPNDADNSYIVHKLRGTHAEAIGDAAVAGLRMPAASAGKKKGAPLAGDQIELIECWIEAGAPE